MTHNLDPCPFCGAADVELHPLDLARAGPEVPLQGSTTQYAHCDGCGAEGPQSFHHDEAVAAWNRRASSVLAGGAE